VDVNGGALANGDPVYLKGPDGNCVGPGNPFYKTGYRSPGPRSQFIIKKADTNSSAARNLRFATHDAFGLTVLGRGYSPLRAAAVASLDLDVPSNNRFACSVETFDVTQACPSKDVPTDSSGTVVIYDRETELYSRSVSKQKKLVLGGVVPITVTVTARG
jgi:hypothetical protein